MLHLQFVFLLIRSISLEAIFIVVPVQHYTIKFFCLHVLLTRASLVALAKNNNNKVKESTKWSRTVI